ncbi:MAG: helix-turn-helix domain-containing protein [Chitinivibrionales bacterium]|nr:helix-turn-helix domain-containing protein [Chitinivibrionales bacterium]
MDKKSIFMDNFSIPMELYNRVFPSRAQIGVIGYITEKREWFTMAFDSFNFSIILQGNGSFTMDGRRWKVSAPCVLTQWPGVHVSYGPLPVWEELYFIYRKRYVPRLCECGFAQREKPVWYLNNDLELRQAIHRLGELFDRTGEYATADKIDRQCESIILESLAGEQVDSPEESRKVIETIRLLLEQQCECRHNFNALALEHGYSPSNLRRYWNMYVGIAPHQYVLRARIQRACKLLLETAQPIKQIAADVGFEDTLYFYRRFKQLTGRTAGAYRRSFRLAGKN